jgi:hypothetical protein
MKRPFSRALAFASLLAGVGVAGGAWSWSTTARGDERASTAALLDELERDAAHKADLAELIKRARGAMERAARLRSAGDESHARLADGLAREQAETARDLGRAIDAERAADDARRGAMDAGTAGDRERALLEEGIARNGRLRAQIDAVAKPLAETKTSAQARTGDGGAPPPPPKGKPAADGGAQ